MRALLSATAFVALAIVSGAVCADESKVALSEVPKGGLEAVKAMFPAAEVTGAAKETDKDKTVFEVTLKEKGRTIDVTVGLDGKIQVVEKEIAAKDLPAAARKAIDSKYPNATFKIVEEVSAMKEGKLQLDFFEALLVTESKEKLEVQVTPDGKIKAEEKKTKDEE